MNAWRAAREMALTGWHAGWLAAAGSDAVLLWGFAVLSWLLVAAGLSAERRRWHGAFVAVGMALVALAVATLH